MKDQTSVKAFSGTSETFQVSHFDEFTSLEIQRKLWAHPSKTSHYPKTEVAPKKVVAPTQKEAARQEKVLSVTELSTLEQLAVETFRRFDPQAFSANLISPSLLKRHFRKLVRELHPDLHPEKSAEPFQQVTEAKHLLQARFIETQMAA